MFYLLLIGGILGGILCIVAVFAAPKPDQKTLAVAGTVLGVAIFIGAWFTPQGKLQFKKLTASGQQGNWLVVDNSGGVTLRHWVLTDAFAESSSQSDGWQFYDDSDNLCYVSGDAYVMRINMPLDSFLLRYKGVYNIPQDQNPCSW